MYLDFLTPASGRGGYVIRHSRFEEGIGWVSEELFDLGDDPEKYIEYVGSHGFYISSKVEEAIREKGVTFEYSELEALFEPFLDPYIRDCVEQFTRAPRRKESRRGIKARLKKEFHTLHPFDRRRICFLRFGQINIEGLVDKPGLFFKVLLDKSRDELENMFYFVLVQRK